jgi:hypothetical protein
VPGRAAPIQRATKSFSDRLDMTSPVSPFGASPARTNSHIQSVVGPLFHKAEQHTRWGSTFLLSRATQALNCSLDQKLGLWSAASSTSFVGTTRNGAQ